MCLTARPVARTARSISHRLLNRRASCSGSDPVPITNPATNSIALFAPAFPEDSVLGFQGFIQIGIGVGIAIGLGFQGFWFLVSCVSWLHPNRDRYRDRDRDRLFTTNSRDGTARGFLERLGEFLIFMKFHVFHGFIQIGIAIGIAIGIGIGIGIGIDCRVEKRAVAFNCSFSVQSSHHCLLRIFCICQGRWTSSFSGKYFPRPSSGVHSVNSPAMFPR